MGGCTQMAFKQIHPGHMKGLKIDTVILHFNMNAIAFLFDYIFLH